MRYFLTASLLLLSGCGVPSMIEGPKPLKSWTSTKPREATAACIYARLEPSEGGRLKKIDLPTEGISYVESSTEGFRHYRFIVKNETKSASAVTFEAREARLDLAGNRKATLFDPTEACFD
jgi:hypothetical protein